VTGLVVSTVIMVAAGPAGITVSERVAHHRRGHARQHAGAGHPLDDISGRVEATGTASIVEDDGERTEGPIRPPFGGVLWRIFQILSATEVRFLYISRQNHIYSIRIRPFPTISGPGNGLNKARYPRSRSVSF
jgi:hypothetical protein